MNAARSGLRRAARAVLVAAACGATACDRDQPGRSIESDSADHGGLVAATIAITIDDLPWIGPVRPGEAREDALQRLIAAFTARDIPAIGFANCERAGGGAPLLRMWVAAGLELGNHTAAHLDLNDAPLDRWLRDVRTCHESVRDISGTSPVWFRFPFLHQGPDVERQSAALALLDELQSPIAHVSIDNSDWILAVAYGAAVTAGDSARAAAVGDAFVRHIMAAVAHYRGVAQDKVGRDVQHVLLLHANLLVADHIGTLLDELSAAGWTFVSVGAAHRDAVYAQDDDYTGPGGLSWLYRIAPATPELSAWDDTEADRLRRAWR